MKILQETTEWSWDVPNHIYVLNDSMTQMIAYVPAGTRTVKRFKKPIPFDRARRTFVPLDDQAPSEPDIQEVQGSQGQIYYVNTQEKSCTCPGFLYRNKCRHIVELTTD